MFVSFLLFIVDVELVNESTGVRVLNEITSILKGVQVRLRVTNYASSIAEKLKFRFFNILDTDFDQFGCL